MTLVNSEISNIRATITYKCKFISWDRSPKYGCYHNIDWSIETYFKDLRILIETHNDHVKGYNMTLKWKLSFLVFLPHHLCIEKNWPLFRSLFFHNKRDNIWIMLVPFNLFPLPLYIFHPIVYLYPYTALAAACIEN